MGITFTRRGYIKLLRDGVQISQHTQAEEAYERAIEHAEANGPGRYVVQYPDREIDVGALILRSAGPAAPASPTPDVFFDDFDYTVTSSSGDAAANMAAFAAAGWADSKATNFGDTVASGNLYTVDVSAIPGFAGSAPGSSSKALCINSNAATAGGQTDFYLQVGAENGPDDTIPGDVWFQFWAYPCRSGSEQSQFHNREKFLYPSNNAYPSSTDKWIFMIGSNSYVPSWNEAPEAGSAYAISRDNSVGTISYAPEVPNGNQSKLGQTDISEYLAVNRWTLVRIHYDTSGANGTFECWMRPQGGSWTKVVEWIGGTTPDFTWTIPTLSQGGHKCVRMPTTMPANATMPSYNSWLYMQDFAIASSDTLLPVY